MNGKSLEQAADTTRDILISFPKHEETLSAFDAARAMARQGERPEKASPILGEGWVAEEALAISLYCALRAESLEDGVIMAVNITGDSDSTGAIAGNLLGALHGASAIPKQWLDPLELKEVIEAVACDLVQIPDFEPDGDEDEWFRRYPAK
jgi:ADP-ribosylglycohydrolase